MADVVILFITPSLAPNGKKSKRLCRAIYSQDLTSKNKLITSNYRYIAGLLAKILFILSLLGIFVPFQTLGMDHIRQLLDKSNNVYDGNPLESFELCCEAEKLAEENGTTEYHGDIAHCKGRYYVLVTKYDLAGKELNKAIAFYKASNDLENLAATYSIKSILLDKIGDHNAAHQLLLKTIELSKESRDSTGMFMWINNLSINYLEQGKLDSMRYCLDELEKMKVHADRTDLYYFNQNQGIYHINSGSYDEGIVWYKKALAIAEDLNMVDSKATLLSLMAEAYRLNGQLSEADGFATLSYEFSLENKLLYESSEALTELIKVKEELNDIVSAYQLQKELTRIEKEIYDLEKVQKVKEIEGQLKVAEKEKDLQMEKLKSAKAEMRNVWMYAILAVVALALFFTMYIVIRTKRLNQTIRLQKKEVELKSANLQEALSNIQDSLQYSKLIQYAMLPSPVEFEQNFIDYFILYKPKDIVSGDFYWLTRSGEKVIFAVGDCTGHGVPGAMVSMVCHEALNKVVKEYGITDPGEILNKVRDLVVSTFEQSKDNLHDGMDIALCVLEGSVLHFSGAHNPLWIVRNDEVIVVKGDKQPVGRFDRPVPFTVNKVQLEPNDILYLFSDGFADQFGGEKGKKLKSANMQKLVHTIRGQELSRQAAALDDAFEQWRGELEQIDDVCIIGVRV